MKTNHRKGNQNDVEHKEVTMGTRRVGWLFGNRMSYGAETTGEIQWMDICVSVSLVFNDVTMEH